MPILMRFERGGRTAAGGASGGVWKTTNFLTSDQIGPGAIWVSRISLQSGGSGVHDHEALATGKAAELFQQARSQGPNGKIYVATDTGVFARTGGGVRNSHNSGALRNVGGSNTWAGASSAGIGRLRSIDGGSTRSSVIRPMSGVALIEIFVSDAPGARWRVFRLRDASVLPSGPGGEVMISFTGLE